MFFVGFTVSAIPQNQQKTHPSLKLTAQLFVKNIKNGGKINKKFLSREVGMAQYSKKSTLFFILFMIFVSAGYLAIVLIGTSMLIPDQKVAVEIAGRLQTTPSWDAIRDHLFDNAFKPGMTREEVHQVLDKVGPWTGGFTGSRDWNDDLQQYVYSEIIRFTEKSTIQMIGQWNFWYTKDDIFVEQAPIDS